MLYKQPFVLYLNISVCLILLFLALPSLLNRREELKVRLAFFLVFFIVIATCLTNLAVLHADNYTMVSLGWFIFFFSLSFGPVLYFYIKSLLGHRVTKGILLSQIPGIAAVSYGLYLAFVSDVEQQRVFQQMLAGEHLFYEVTNLFPLILTLVYCVKAWRFIKKFKGGKNKNQKAPSDLKVVWAREFIIYMFVNVFVFLILVLMLTNLTEVTTMDMDLIGMPVFMLFVYLLVAIRSMMMYKEFEHQFILARIESEKQIQDQRLEIARDLHDSLGAQLTFIAAVSDGIKRNAVSGNEILRNKADTLTEFTENAISELKNALWVLNAEAIRLDDLKNKLLNFVKAAGEAREDVAFHFQFSIQDNFTVDSKWAVNIFRMVQEIINNASKYAEAKDLWINASQTGALLKLEIRDNGIGFDRETVKTNSYGLSNLQQRVQTMEGVMRMETEKGEGTNYFIEIPLR